MKEQKHLVFVYGTLMTGQRNHHYLAEAELIWHDCWTYGELYDTGKGYPAMVQHPEHRVYGELYRVTADQLRQVDMLEGYAGPGQNNHYERIEQKITKVRVTLRFWFMFIQRGKFVGWNELIGWIGDAYEISCRILRENIENKSMWIYNKIRMCF